MQNVVLAFLMLMSLSAYNQCIEGDCENGFGKFKCDCGYVFNGEFKNGEKYFGTLTKEDLVYTGFFKNDVAHGKGKIVYRDSSWYEGDFEYNEANGFGTFHFADGWEYRGYFRDDVFTGLGVLTDSNQQNFDIGIFESDKLGGVGFRLRTGKPAYFGMFEEGVEHQLGLQIADDVMEAGKFKGRLKKHLNFQEEAGWRVAELTDKIAAGQVEYTLYIDSENQLFVLDINTETRLLRYVYDSRKQLFLRVNEDNNKTEAIGLHGEVYQVRFSFEGGIEKL